MRIKEFLRQFARDESGHDGIEYAVTASIIGIALLVTFQFFGQTVNSWFVTMNSTLRTLI